MLVLVKFIGHNGSLGFIFGKTYKLLLSRNIPNKIECISEENRGVVCRYDSIVGFLSNWEMIEVLDFGVAPKS